MDLTAWQQAQSAVLGSLLIDPDRTAGLVFAQARAEHFSDAGMRHVFEAARELWRGKRPVDPVTVLAAAGDSYAPLIEGCMPRHRRPTTSGSIST